MTVDHKTTQWVARLIVLVTGVAMGFFIWNSAFGHVSPRYPLAFTQGQWLITPDKSPQGYFRSELYIPLPVRQAWVMIAATDSFSLYVNGRLIDEKEDTFRHVSGIYDIGHALQPGKNVIGVGVRRVTHPGPAKAVVEGSYRDQIGRQHVFFSDVSWKARSHEAFQGNGRILWYMEGFQADAWRMAQVAGVPSMAEVAPVRLHPVLFTATPEGKWISLARPHPQVQAAIFRRTFDVGQKIQGAWVRIASDEQYDLIIDDMIMIQHEVSGKMLDMYDVGPFLNLGIHTIDVHASSGQQYPLPRLLLDIVILKSGHTQTILTTDASWQAKPLAAVQADADVKPLSGWEPALVLGDDASSIDALLKHPGHISTPMVYVGRQTLRLLACVFLVLLCTLLVWRGVSFLLHRLRQDITLDRARMMDALCHLPCFLFLGSVYLMQYDKHYDPSFPFQATLLYVAIVSLLSLRIGLWLEVLTCKRRSGAKEARVFMYRTVSSVCRYRMVWLVLCLAMIGVAGLTMRIHNAKTTSLSHDEVGIAGFARSALERVYPVKTVGPIEKPLTTYELLPYPIALSLRLFGISDVAVRLPSIVFGIGTIALMFYVGMRLWGTWTGILAAAIYAFSPFAILWGSNAFHPQQTQFFALVTSYLFYKAIGTTSGVLQPRYLYGAALCLILTYLSWEGSGLLLLSLFICLLMIKGKDTSWLRSTHLWMAAALVGTTVFLQLSHRILANVPYLIVGQGLSGQTFNLAFLTPLYYPWFYVQNFLLVSHHIILTLLVILGLPLVFKHQGIKYYCTLLVSLLLALTHLLPNLSTRYSYFLQPFLILPASAIAVYVVSSIWNLKERISRVVSATQGGFAVAFPLVIFLSTNTLVLHLDRLGSRPMGDTEIFPEVYAVDYRSTSQFIQNQIVQGDVVISLMPHTLAYYTDQRSSYYMQAYTHRQVVYDVSQQTAGYLDKYVGSPVVRNLTELKEVLSRYRRVWIVAAPYSLFRSSNDALIRDFIAYNCQVVYESYKTKVYLWER